MSATSVQSVLARAVKEPEFRGLLLHQPGQALAGYELTTEEIGLFTKLTPETFDVAASDLENRTSQAVVAASSGAPMSNKAQDIATTGS